MMSKRFRPGRAASAVLAVGAALFIASCQSSGNPATTGATTEDGLDAAQPRTASYSCADGGLITVENLGTSVRLLGAEGESVELPASPASQRNRYGEAADAIVLDGREALIMRGGQEPLACTR